MTFKQLLGLKEVKSEEDISPTVKVSCIEFTMACIHFSIDETMTFLVSKKLFKKLFEQLFLYSKYIKSAQSSRIIIYGLTSFLKFDLEKLSSEVPELNEYIEEISKLLVQLILRY